MLSLTLSLTAFESATLAFNAALVAMLRAMESGAPPPESAFESAMEISVDWEMFWLLATEKLPDSMTLFEIDDEYATDASTPAEVAVDLAVESTVVPFGLLAIGGMPSFFLAVSAFSTLSVSPLIVMGR